MARIFAAIINFFSFGATIWDRLTSLGDHLGPLFIVAPFLGGVVFYSWLMGLPGVDLDALPVHHMLAHIVCQFGFGLLVPMITFATIGSLVRTVFWGVQSLKKS